MPLGNSDGYESATTSRSMRKDCREAVLSIAGSDPSGGAGIQADLKTFSAAGVYGAAAITCLTAQNTCGVTGIMPVPVDFVRKQVRLVLEDMPVTHIKTGMIGTASIAEALGELLMDFAGQIVCDPVLAASDGHALFEDNALKIYRKSICGAATVLTPNTHELALLSGRNIEDEGSIMEASIALFNEFPRLEAIAAKGGHMPEKAGSKISDFLLLRSASGKPAILQESHPRLQTQNTHGTGCTFSAAYTAFLLIHGSHHKAFTRTVSFMDQLLRLSVPAEMGRGPHGPMLHHLCQSK